VEVGVGMPAVHEPFTPVAWSDLSPGHGGALEVEQREEAELAERAGMQHQARLQQAELSQRVAPGHRIRLDVGRPGVQPDRAPDRSLCGPGARAQTQEERPNDKTGRRRPGPLSRGRLHHDYSASATAPRPAVKLPRRKSRFMRVIVSMLISLGQAS
jgi:hypothetical protein